MSKTQGSISKILTFSCVDGPGNRMVIFFQGCNFDCPTCHNPHTLGVCDHCGVCLEVCRTGALHMNQGHVCWQENLCEHCDECLAACPIRANPKARLYHVEDLITIIHQNKAFLSGVTVTGGEATLQLPFIYDFFSAVKADPQLEHLTTMVDSNGHLDIKGWQTLIPVMDGAMIDLKAWDKATHKRLTGHSHERVLSSLRFLFQNRKLYEVRYLVIPGLTDTISQLQGSADFLKQLDANIRVRLNAFQHHGVRKDGRQWPSCNEEHMTAVATQLQNMGLRQLIKPTVYL